jgi:hypothetical protein
VSISCGNEPRSESPTGIAEPRNRNQITSPLAVRNLSTPRRASLPIGAGLRSVHSRYLWYTPAARCYRKPCSQSSVARSLGKFLNHSADALRPGSSHVQLTGATGPNTSIHGHLSSPGALLPPPAPSCDFSTASDPRAKLLIHCSLIHHRMRPPSRLRQVLGHITPISATGMSAGEHPHSNLLSRSRWTQIGAHVSRSLGDGLSCTHRRRL